MNQKNVDALTAVVRAVFDRLGIRSDPILIGACLADRGVLVPSVLTEDEANRLPVWDWLQHRNGDTEGTFLQAAADVRAELERIAKGEA